MEERPGLIQVMDLIRMGMPERSGSFSLFGPQPASETRTFSGRMTARLATIITPGTAGGVLERPSPVPHIPPPPVAAKTTRTSTHESASIEAGFHAYGLADLGSVLRAEALNEGPLQNEPPRFRRLLEEDWRASRISRARSPASILPIALRMIPTVVSSRPLDVDQTEVLVTWETPLAVGPPTRETDSDTGQFTLRAVGRRIGNLTVATS